MNKFILLILALLSFERLLALESFETLNQRVQAIEDKVRSLKDRSTFVPQIVQGRLTVETGTPISTTDQTSKSAIYFTPYLGNLVTLYDGSAWQFYKFSEVSLALSALTSDKNYDVFLYNNSGTLTLSLSSAWTDDTTRADALTTQDGVYVKSGAATYRYLGTLRTTSTTTTESSAAKRFLWNYYNRAPLQMLVTDTTNSWSYQSASYRSANASTANRVQFVVGIAEVIMQAQVLVNGTVASTYADGNPGIGYDSTTVSSSIASVGGFTRANEYRQTSSLYIGTPGIGFHFLQWLEMSGATRVVFYGDAGGTTMQSGISARYPG